MFPSLRTGDELIVADLNESPPKVGDIILKQRSPGHLIAHRVIRVTEESPLVETAGDACLRTDTPWYWRQSPGKVIGVRRGNRMVPFPEMPSLMRRKCWGLAFGIAKGARRLMRGRSVPPSG